MLQRDFGVRIYKALLSLPDKEDKKDKKNKKDEKKEKREERDDENDDPKPKRRKSGDDKDKKDDRDDKKVGIIFLGNNLPLFVCVYYFFSYILQNQLKLILTVSIFRFCLVGISK